MYTITKGPSKLVAQRRTGAWGEGPGAGRAAGGRVRAVTAQPRRRLTRPVPAGPSQQQVESRLGELLKCRQPAPPTPSPPRAQPPGPWPLSSGPLSQGGPPSGGGAPEPRKASRPAGPRVPGGVARAAQDSRLPPPAVGAGPAPSTAPSWALCVQGQASCRQLERPITALGPADWDRPSGSLDIPHPVG
uniref:MAPK regulated corepressor interacting protein 2 n=1 Tax=Panthera leo TaxID=9689 RepID=A0A8C9D8B1_PANLE